MSRPKTPALSLRLVFARNVRLMRVNAGLSQEKMAAEAQLDRTFVGSLERGERNISIDNVEHIAKVLAVPAYELMQADFAQQRGLDETVLRAPRTKRLYPVAPKPRGRKTTG
jgi:transcriptional regulator with XRE-family HTH domain